MDNSRPSERKKYYINVCRPLIAVPGCDRRASVCQMEYQHDHVSSLSIPAGLPSEWGKGGVCRISTWILASLCKMILCVSVMLAYSLWNGRPPVHLFKEQSFNKHTMFDMHDSLSCDVEVDKLHLFCVNCCGLRNCQDCFRNRLLSWIFYLASFWLDL